MTHVGGLTYADAFGAKTALILPPSIRRLALMTRENRILFTASANKAKRKAPAGALMKNIIPNQNTD